MILMKCGQLLMIYGSIMTPTAACHALATFLMSSAYVTDNCVIVVVALAAFVLAHSVGAMGRENSR